MALKLWDWQGNVLTSEQMAMVGSSSAGIPFWVRIWQLGPESPLYWVMRLWNRRMYVGIVA